MGIFFESNIPFILNDVKLKSWNKCSCVDSLVSLTNVSDANCNLPCYGNTLYNLELCGGLDFYSVFSTGKSFFLKKIKPSFMWGLYFYTIRISIDNKYNNNIINNNNYNHYFNHNNSNNSNDFTFKK